MELRTTLYLKITNKHKQDLLFDMLEEGEIYSASLKKLFTNTEGHIVDKLFEKSGVDAYYCEDPYKEEGYIVVSFVGSNGSENSYEYLIDFFYEAFSVTDARIKGQGEENYYIFIRRGNNSTELRHWEDGDFEELMENQQWFNDGLPETLQENEIDFY